MLLGLFRNRPCPCERKLQALDDDLKSMRLAWEEVQDKVYHWMQRTKKRDRDEAASTAPPAVHPVVAAIEARRALARRNGIPPVLPLQG
jgi:hypothetical protein